jgi:hypothetical protein
MTSTTRSAQWVPIDVPANSDLIDRVHRLRAALASARREVVRLRVDNKELQNRLADLPAPSRPTPDIWLG